MLAEPLDRTQEACGPSPPSSIVTATWLPLQLLDLKPRGHEPFAERGNFVEGVAEEIEVAGQIRMNAEELEGSMKGRRGFHPPRGT